MCTKDVTRFDLKRYHGNEAAGADLPPLLKNSLISATLGDGVLIDDLPAVNEDFILSTIVRNLSLIFLTVALIFLLSVRLLVLIFLSPRRRPLSM